jgi:hypothetical protein
MKTTLRAKCLCGSTFQVTVGRKSTVRVATCECGAVYDYSAWQLAKPDTSASTVGAHTFCKVEAFKREK